MHKGMKRKEISNKTHPLCQIRPSGFKSFPRKGKMGVLRGLEINLQEYKVLIRGKTTNWCLIFARMREERDWGQRKRRA